MKYKNKCPISLEPLTKEDAFLIKIPKTGNEAKDLYYYIGNEETLDKLLSCPISRRQGHYYVLKLSEKILSNSQDIASLLLERNNTLIEDNTVLAQLDTENVFNWQLRQFVNTETNLLPEIPDENLRAFNHHPDYARQLSQAEAVSRRLLFSMNRHFISDYKLGFLRHPFPRSIRVLDSLRPENLARYCDIVNELMNNALLEEHDLTFLIHSYKLIYTLEDGPSKIALQNAVYTQLTRYATSVLILTNALSLVVDLLSNGFSSSTGFRVLEILFIESVQDSLERLFRENSQLKIQSVLSHIFLDSLKHLANPFGIYSSAKNATANAYTLIKTNVSFFYNKFFKSEPVPTPSDSDDDLPIMQRN